ncbi:ribonuclease H-like domain-containing protein [Tanacetum coccineum]
MLAMEEGCVMSILDAIVIKEGTRDELMAVSNLAMRCLNLNGKNRPTMKEVALERDVLGAALCVLPSALSTMANRDPTWNMDTGDLYPVTSPSLTPHALLSVSPSTWHQCLGHPGEDVLRFLKSRQYLSYNKEKSSHLCHACQLEKHVRLPFTSSNSIVTLSFEIVHSDIWTSPIASYGGFKYYLLQPLASLQFFCAYTDADWAEMPYYLAIIASVNVFS